MASLFSSPLLHSLDILNSSNSLALNFKSDAAHSGGSQRDVVDSPTPSWSLDPDRGQGRPMSFAGPPMTPQNTPKACVCQDSPPPQFMQGWSNENGHTLMESVAKDPVSRHITATYDGFHRITALSNRQATPGIDSHSATDHNLPTSNPNWTGSPQGFRDEFNA